MELLERIDSELEAVDTARSCIDDVFASFENQLLENDLAKLEVPFAVDLAMAKIEAMIKLATMRYDGISSPNDPFEKMDADSEPVPPPVDSWARGTVATRKVITEPEAGFRKSVPSAPSNTPSVSSYRSGTSYRSKTTSGTKSRLGTGLGRTSEKDDSAGKIIELDDDLDKEFGGRAGTAFSSTGPMFDQMMRMKKKKDPSTFNQADNDDEKDEFDMIKEQMAKAAKDVRGKNFVLDRYGQPVVLGKVNADNLPSFTVSPSSSIVEANLGKNSKAPSPRNSSQQAKASKVIRVAGARDVPYGFEPNTSLAVTLSNLDSIEKVNPGVVLSSSQQRKAGDTFPEDPKHVSRKTLIVQTNLSPQPSISLDSQSQTSQNYPSLFSKTNSMASEGGQRKDGKQTGSKSRKPLGGTVKFSNNSSDYSSPADLLQSLPDVNPLSGSISMTDFEEDDSGTEGQADSRSKSQGISFSPPRLPVKPSQDQRKSIELLRGTRGNKGIPRDRDLPQNIRSVSERRHLPAPPLGFTTGHGLDMHRVMEQLSSNSLESSQSAWHQQWRN